MKIRTLIEPFKVKVVEAITTTTVEQRIELLKRAKYNLFALHSNEVMIDLLTDSGTGAMSDRQWSAMISGDEAYAGSESYWELERACKDIFGFPEVMPTHQGRAAEHLLFGQTCKAGDLVPNNTHFDTTRANLEVLGVEAVDLPLPCGRDTQAKHPFKGNMDVEALDNLLAAEGHRVPMVHLTLTNNSGGGQPVSLANIAAVSAVCNTYDKPLFIDAARFAENCYFIKLRENGYSSYSPIEIARELYSLADGMWMSSKKDGLVNIGGLLCLRDSELAQRLRTQLILMEGFPTYGGLAGRDLAALAVGLYEALDEHYLAYRLRTAEYMAEKLREDGVAIMEPPGGHAIYIDCKRVLPHLRSQDFPGQSLACALYIAGGIRSVEIGSVMFGHDDEDGNFVAPANELLRMAFPRRTYTQSHFDYVAEVVRWVHTVADRLPAMEITWQPPFLRHFTCHFKPAGAFPRPDQD